MFDEYLFQVSLNSMFNPIRWSEDEDSFIAEAVIPGLSEEDVTVTLTRNILKLSFKGNDYVNGLDESWRLDKAIKAKDITPKVDKGILTIKVKKPTFKTESIKVE